MSTATRKSLGLGLIVAAILCAVALPFLGVPTLSVNESEILSSQGAIRRSHYHVHWPLGATVIAGLAGAVLLVVSRHENAA
jgi:predicted DNA-binding protein with PD1-like motif